MKKATETLVKAAQQASVQVEEEGGGAFGPSVSYMKRTSPECYLVLGGILEVFGVELKSYRGIVNFSYELFSLCVWFQVKGGVMKDWRKELETQERIVRMQRELEKAKEDLYKIRKERAKH